MPRAPSPNRAEAKRLYLASGGKEKLHLIAKELDVSEGTVRGWKTKDKWDAELSGTPKKKQKNAPKKRGAPYGNKNAVGNKGGAPCGPAHGNYKHGAYADVYWDFLSDDERMMIDGIPEDMEALLIEQVQYFAIRERRLSAVITKYRNMKTELIVDYVNRTETKRDFSEHPEEKDLYDELRQQKITEDKISYLGRKYQLTTVTESVDNRIHRWETELTKVQRAKTQVLQTLSRYRIDRERLEMEREGADMETEDMSDTDGDIYG